MSDRIPETLPATWVRASLLELGTWAGGGTPSKDNREYWTGGAVPWVSPKDMKSFEIHDTEDHITEESIAASATSKVPSGAVLMVTRSGILRHTFPVAVARREVTLNQDLKALVLREPLDPVFVAYALRAFAEQILHTCSKDGTTVQSIDSAALKRFEIPIAPAKEQTRIAEALDEIFSDLDDAVASLERVRERLKIYRASVLKAAVEGTITADWRAAHPNAEPASELLDRILVDRRQRWEEEQLAKFAAGGREPPKNWKTKYKEPVAAQNAGLPELPEGWCWATVEQLGEVRLGRQRAPQHHQGDHMRPYLRVANVYEDRLDLRDVKQMNFTPSEFETYSLRYGDILLNEGQSPELVGRPAMYRDEIAGCCYQKTLLRFRAHDGVLSAYLLSIFRAYLHNGRFRKSANITTSIAHLAAERFVIIEIPLPPAAEQMAIVEAVEDHLSIIEHLEADLAANTRSAQGLRQSILRHAFSGQLVPQDPNDEPASELLERIARECQVSNNGASRRRAAPARKRARSRRGI